MKLRSFGQKLRSLYLTKLLCPTVITKPFPLRSPHNPSHRVPQSTPMPPLKFIAPAAWLVP